MENIYPCGHFKFPSHCDVGCVSRRCQFSGTSNPPLPEQNFIYSSKPSVVKNLSDHINPGINIFTRQDSLKKIISKISKKILFFSVKDPFHFRSLDPDEHFFRTVRLWLKYSKSGISEKRQ